jgi:metallo-beta-lactamase class B
VKRIYFASAAIVTLTACGPRELQPDAPFECDQCDAWNEPQEPFRVHGNTWFVGTGGLSSILIESDDGLILIDGGLPQSAALIDANIRSLGFDPLSIKAILLSHPHFDHAGGGQLSEDDPQYVADAEYGSFPGVSNVTVVSDGEFVSVGNVDVRAVYTPGHTAGSVTWTWESCALNSCYDVVYADSMSPVSAQGFSFAATGVADQIIESAGIIGDLDCDILLSPHPFFFGMYDKLERRDEGNPFVNGLACMFYAESSLDWLEQRLKAEGGQPPVNLQE